MLMLLAHTQGTPTLEQLKLKYYDLVIAYHAHQNDYLEICRCYRAVYESPSIADSPEKKQAVLRKICWYSVLAAASSDQVGVCQLPQGQPGEEIGGPLQNLQPGKCVRCIWQWPHITGWRHHQAIQCAVLATVGVSMSLAPVQARLSTVISVCCLLPC